jgi:hypothetical protein
MKTQTMTYIFNWFLFDKFNFGLWKWPVYFKFPNFSGYNFSKCAKYGISWLGYTLEISWIKN